MTAYPTGVTEGELAAVLARPASELSTRGWAGRRSTPRPRPAIIAVPEPTHH
ncbi:hypothetical protein [Winogradskya humida]|uniref:hypothetical protein n=1 Tax=Winogradskya humida TaxID=113566 RepID=UPI001940BE70|nr:hypothetical protein [Actinoplanes humidus]